MVTKTIEEKYKKLSQREHVLLRSGMYIGSTKKQNEELWVADIENEDYKMVKKVISYTPGFIKIFDEVLTNATDHSFRDPTLTQIKVTFDKESGEISIWNNGTGIPIELHKDHSVYVPELIFGNLLSGSNYDDKDSRTGAGTNGIGSKVVNIFSKKFIVETVDSNNKKKFIQEFTENMTIKGKPKVTSNSGKSYTKITFLPDYPKFEMRGLEDDTILLLRKRVLDCIACTSKDVAIYLNGTKLKGKGLVDYIKYFFEESKVISERIVEKKKNVEFVWEYAIVPYQEYSQISFVNGNATNQGGKHVDYILYQITKDIKRLLEEKKKLTNVTPNFIKDKFFFFLNATVVNPSFNSQTKEQLTTPSKDFGCIVNVSEAFINKIYKSPIIQEIVEFCKAKEVSTLNKTTDGKKVNKLYIPKLEDALWAGTKRSVECTLILTEGDSAKSFALAGRSVVGNEKYGVYPLKGKALNVRDATVSQLINNEEINSIKQILGLKNDKKYNNVDDLRYGKVMILTDADCDGSHIKSLLVNLFHYWWPDLLKIKPNFLQTLKTPIVKATSTSGKKVIEFFNEQDYSKWTENNSKELGKYKIKYFKGLGTSKKEDAKDIFKRIKELTVDYYYSNSHCDESILLAFDKDKNNTKTKTKIKEIDEDLESNDSNNSVISLKCTDKRKEWLRNYDKNSYIDMKQQRVSYSELINKELIHFSIYDNMRSIPSLCDGFKPSQRKIMYYLLKKRQTEPIKVAQLSGYVSAETAYHHGEVSLQGAIVNMAQDFVGSNNLNLLYPDGAFGSGYLLGKDAASPRYIFTCLQNYSLDIFNPVDNNVLDYINEEGQVIEPEFFVPIIPMILVNGCEGIGTGFSTKIPSHNPLDIITILKNMLKDTEYVPTQTEMLPYFRGFKGTVEKIEEQDSTWVTRGKYTRLDDNKVRVTCLPIGQAITPYKEFLEGLISSNKKDKKKTKFELVDVINRTKDENEVVFDIEFKKEELDKLIKSDTFEKDLKLVKSFSTNNMYLFNQSLILTKYSTPIDIMLDYFDIRLSFYVKRRKWIITQLKREVKVLQNKSRFVKEYIEGDLKINKRSKSDIISILIAALYDTDNESYDYLLNMPIYSMSLEKIEELNKKCKEKEEELKLYQKRTPEDLWLIDLETLEKKLKN
jgi:DNA topoisomerase-2